MSGFSHGFSSGFTRTHEGLAAFTRLGMSGFPRGLYGSFTGKTEAEVSVGAGWPVERRRRVILPDGRRIEATPEQIAYLREKFSYEIAQAELQAESKPQKRRKGKARQRAVSHETPVELQAEGTAPLVLPPRLAALERGGQQDALENQITAMLRQQEDDTLLLVLMLI